MLAGFIGLLVALPGALALSPTHNKLIELAEANGGVIKLDSSLYEVLTAPDREWSAVVQLTAMGSQFKCAPCKEFAPNFKAVANSWHKKVPKDTREGHFFAVLDFADGQQTFKKLGLTSAPFVNFWPAAQGPLKRSGKVDSWTYDFNTLSFDAGTFAREMSKHTPRPIPYSAPINYGLYISVTTTVVLGLIAARFAYPYLSAFIFSRWLWATFTIGTMLVMTSGHMFVKIRQMPVTSRNQWIASGYQTQFGMETRVVAVLYGTLALSHVALTLLVPRIPSASRQRAGIYTWSIVMGLLFSILVWLFRMKNPGYPFRLLF